MIKYIPVKYSFKANWLDHNGTLVGYSNDQQCCERFGCGVYEVESGKLVAETPNGLPYHFAKNAVISPSHTFTKDVSYENDGNFIHVSLISDDPDTTLPELIFELYNCHNGYYMHAFNMKVDFNENNLSSGTEIVSTSI